ncbi:MAG TPA: hypothetical protein VN688_06970, partial [Gemmataceae bacterium]|nr:hypothetical protein [Gemmataceae bacterium]
MTRQEFAAVMAYVGAGCGKTLGEDALKVYYDLLSDLPLDVLQLAAKRALLESHYPVFPPVGVLRKLAAEIMRPPAMPALEAWGVLQRAIDRYGDDNPQQGLDALPEPIRAVAEQFGWRQLCRCNETEILRAQFSKAYDTAQARERATWLLPVGVRQAVAELGARHDGAGRLEQRDGADKSEVDPNAMRRAETQKKLDLIRREGGSGRVCT